MNLTLFGHPFSSYCQKALIALYENATPFLFRRFGPGDPTADAEFAALWPIRRFPLLVDDGVPVAEASIIIEHLSIHHPGPVHLIPADAEAALEVRFLDRFFDNYVMGQMQRIVANALLDQSRRDEANVADARKMLDIAYAWLESHMAGREWAAIGAFTMADCAAAPALFYADWVHPIDDRFEAVRRYRDRLNKRPSFSRAVDEARPYRWLFPLGAPDRD